MLEPRLLANSAAKLLKILQIVKFIADFFFFLVIKNVTLHQI